MVELWLAGGRDNYGPRSLGTVLRRVQEPHRQECLGERELPGKFSRGVEHFYPAIERQENENKGVSLGFWDAVMKPVGEANRGSL